MQPNSRGSGKPATSMLLEMATLCHPSYCQLSCLNPIIHRVNKDIPLHQVQEFATNLKKNIQDKVINLAILVAGGRANAAATEARHLNFVEVDDLAEEMSDLMNLESTESKVRQSFYRYSREQAIPKTRKEQEDILEWWKSKQYEYPYLSVVARCLLATEASSGTIEVDNGIGGLFVPKNRLSTESSLLEMKLFVKRNEEFLYWNMVKCLAAEERQNFIPVPPVIPFVECEDDEFGGEEDEDLIE
jgi:hypothetical protein